MSVSKATALVLSELGVAVFFVVGSARSLSGESAPWFVLGACLLGFLVRAIDIESWAFFIPGGLIGRTERVYGARAGSVATAVMLTERLLLVALTCVLCGQYLVSFGISWISQWSLTARLSVQELVTVGSVLMIGILWTRIRLGLPLPSVAMVKGIWAGVVVILALSVVGSVALLRHGMPILAPTLVPSTQETLVQQVFHWLIAAAMVLPVLGGGGSLGRSAREFAPPRLNPVRRTALFVAMFVLILAVSTSFLFVAAVPKEQAAVWSAIPLSALAQFLPVPAWATGLLTVLIFGAAMAMLVPAANAAFEDTEQLLRRLSAETIFSDSAASVGGVAATAAGLIAIVSGAQVSWLGRAYGIAIAAALLLRIGVNLRLRRVHREPQPFRMPSFAYGLVAVIVGLSLLGMFWRRDVPSFASLGLIFGLGITLAVRRKRAAFPASVEDSAFDLAKSGDLSLEHVEAKPGNIIVTVRHPHSLSHLVEAMKAAGDRDVVVLAVRVLGADVDDEAGRERHPLATSGIFLPRLLR